LEEEPEIEERLLPYVDAFAVLSAGRTVGMAANPIPLTEIEAYCRLYQVEDTDRFIRLIRAMDGAYMDYMDHKAEKAKANQNGHRHSRPQARRGSRPPKRR
jgi:hypothetical protein